MEYDLSDLINQVCLGVNVASRSSVRFLDGFFSLLISFASFLGSPSLQTDGLMTAPVPPPPPPKSKPHESSQRNSTEVGHWG